jgi:hypothetical protein
MSTWLLTTICSHFLSVKYQGHRIEISPEPGACMFLYRALSKRRRSRLFRPVQDLVPRVVLLWGGAKKAGCCQGTAAWILPHCQIVHTRALDRVIGDVNRVPNARITLTGHLKTIQIQVACSVRKRSDKKPAVRTFRKLGLCIQLVLVLLKRKMGTGFSIIGVATGDGYTCQSASIRRAAGVIVEHLVNEAVHSFLPSKEAVNSNSLSGGADSQFTASNLRFYSLGMLSRGAISPTFYFFSRSSAHGLRRLTDDSPWALVRS